MLYKFLFFFIQIALTFGHTSDHTVQCNAEKWQIIIVILLSNNCSYKNHFKDICFVEYQGGFSLILDDLQKIANFLCFHIKCINFLPKKLCMYWATWKTQKFSYHDRIFRNRYVFCLWRAHSSLDWILVLKFFSRFHVAIYNHFLEQKHFLHQ